MTPSGWIPMRWPVEWREPATLRLLEGTPINCLVFRELGDDLAQVIEAARRRGLAVVGPGETSVAWLTRPEVSRQPASPVRAFTDNVWPSIKLSSRGEKDAADAGPTGIPWIDSNGWFVQLARTMAPAGAVWIAADPPDDQVILPAESYGTAIADAAACGGRWVVSLDSRLRRELAGGEPQALATWRNVTHALALYESHKDWRAWRPMGVLGVLSDFHGPNEFLSMEALNLISRRQLPVHILDRTKPGAESWEGLQAILYIDQEPPALALREKLLAFACSGGLLICPPACSNLISAGLTRDAAGQKFRVHDLERGRIAIARTDFEDPYVLAADAHVVLGRRHDVIRSWNAGSIIFHCAAAPGGARAVVHLVSYTHRPTEFITLAVRGRWRSARFWTAGSESPVRLNAVVAGGMAELHLPPVSMYAAVELEAA